jgi:hypothetical protein
MFAGGHGVAANILATRSGVTSEKCPCSTPANVSTHRTTGTCSNGVAAARRSASALAAARVRISIVRDDTTWA